VPWTRRDWAAIAGAAVLVLVGAMWL
jgi:hypothetical protein